MSTTEQPPEDERQKRLNERFGLPGFRPWQREAIDELLDGSRRVLAIAPTGGGKSLCYQYPAVELPGLSLVICPLIALMEDQVRSLTERGIAATYLASNLSSEERRARLRGLRQGQYKLVYVAPERLAHPHLLDEIRALEPALVAIDEAHCISQWGHDFRPDYLRIGDILQELNPKHVLACTATATPAVRQEVVERLGLGPDAKVILRGFARPNLHLVAEEVDGKKPRVRLMVRTLKEALGSPTAPKGGGIIYASTRRQTEEIADALRVEGWKASAYHAGLPNEERSRVAANFSSGDLTLVSATNAFGMGIDRSDIRTVIHFAAPGSIEAYYQEVGRAGRDGQPAMGLLITGGADIGLRKRLIELGREEGEASEARRAQQWKLFRDLLRYVEAGSCRHDFILRYFGDEQELLGGCGHCDVCERLEARGGEERKLEPEGELLIKKALSAVARARQRGGLQAIAEMLKGADNVRIKRMGFDKLSTYGLLAEHELKWIVGLLRRLLSAGLMDLTPGDYPMPYLTPQGVNTMKGLAPVRVLPPPEDYGRAKPKKARYGKSKPKREEPAGMDHQLYEQLRAERLLMAKEKGVPAYVICHDRTLMEIAADRPSSTTELADVRGMGPARIEAYGERFLALVAG